MEGGIKLKRINPNTYTDKDNYVELEIDSPTFGVFKIAFDKEFEESVKQYHWTIMKAKCPRSKYYTYYVYSTKTKHCQKQMLLHRFIMGNPRGMIVDHIDGNTMDNRKSNLRICTFQENCRNRKMSRRNSSGYLGVTWVEKEHKWMAYIHLNLGKTFKNLGYYTDLEEAHQARVKAEDKYYGNYLRVDRTGCADKTYKAKIS